MPRARRRAMTAGESRPSTSVLAGGACPAAARVSSRAHDRRVLARQPRRVRRLRTNSAGGAGKVSPLALSSPEGNRRPRVLTPSRRRTAWQRARTAGVAAKRARKVASPAHSNRAKTAHPVASARSPVHQRTWGKGASSSARRAHRRRLLAMRRRKRHPEASRRRAPAVAAVAGGVAAGAVAAKGRSRATRRRRGVDSSPLTAAAPAVDRS